LQQQLVGPFLRIAEEEEEEEEEEVVVVVESYSTKDLTR